MCLSFLQLIAGITSAFKRPSEVDEGVREAETSCKLVSSFQYREPVSTLPSKEGEVCRASYAAGDVQEFPGNFLNAE